MFKKNTSYFMRLSKRRADRMLDKIVADVREGNHDPTALESESDGVITIHEDSLEIKSPKQTTSIPWVDIAVIFTYQLDCFTYDLACIALGASKDSPALEAVENMQGYVALTNKLEQLFPGFEEDYLNWRISTRAFDTTPTIIWEKES